MTARFLLSPFIACCLSVLPTLGCASRAEDPPAVKRLQEAVANLEKKLADLEAKVAALEKQGKAEPSAKVDKNEEEYVKAMVGAALENMLAGDVVGLHTKLSSNLLRGINGTFTPGEHFHDEEIGKWIKKWNPDLKYRAYTIDKVLYSPAKDEAVITGTLSAKQESAKASFTLTLVKDKDKGTKFLIDAISVKP
jgi:hypothetical protein